MLTEIPGFQTNTDRFKRIEEMNVSVQNFVGQHAADFSRAFPVVVRATIRSAHKTANLGDNPHVQARKV